MSDRQDDDDDGDHGLPGPGVLVAAAFACDDYERRFALAREHFAKLLPAFADGPTGLLYAMYVAGRMDQACQMAIHMDTAKEVPTLVLTKILSTLTGEAGVSINDINAATMAAAENLQ